MPTNIDTAVEIYSNKFIAGLTRALAPLRAFSLDLSDDIVQEGESVNVPLVTADTVDDWDDETNNYARSKQSLKARSVKINKRKICGFPVTQTQMANFRPNYWEGKADLNQKEMADAVLADVISLVKPENYGDTAAKKINVALAEFKRLAVAALRAKIVKAKLIPAKCVLALNPDFFSALLADLDSQVYGGREAVVGGAIPGLLGFRAIIEVPQYEQPGFVCHPDAIAVGSRKVPIADTTPYKEFGGMVEPETGLTLNRVVYTEGATGKTNFSTECWYGYDVGNADALVRLVG
ncbi:MAG TPA: hypothetical protein PLY53_15770 [Planctomycetota bacterium]|nr:hypothetical protein [Planctomycetota bacterium]